MIKLEFYDPSGTIDVTQGHAPRLPSLNGKRIGFLTNEQWQAYYALPLLKAMIEEDFPDAEVLALDAFPKGNEAIGTDDTARRVKESGVDAIIIGNAA